MSNWKFGPQIVDWLMNEGQRVDPNQPDREVYENGVEAGAKRCTFFGFIHEDDNGDLFLLKAHADDGCGMDVAAHLDYLSTLFNTGAAKTTASIGAPKNKGVGARVASLARNPAGVDFYSRTEAEKKTHVPWHLVRLLPTGPVIWVTPSGPSEIVEAEDDAVLQIETFLPNGYGTVGVFHGDGTDDTWTEVAWKATYDYMQKRYWTLPTPLILDGRYLPSMKGKPRASYRYHVDSLSEYYAKHVGPEGTMTLSDGTDIDWFVFDHTAKGVSFDAIQKSGVNKGKPVGVDMPSGPSRTAGFRGVALYDQNELFEHSPYRPSFGIIGRAVQRVSLIVTPAASLSAEQTTNRQHLERHDGEEWDYTGWGNEFVDNMPDEIKKLMESDWKLSETITAADLDLLDPDWYKRVVAKPQFLLDPDGAVDVENPEPVVAREGGGGRAGGGCGGHGGHRDGGGEGTKVGSHHSADRERGTKVRKSAVNGHEGDWSAFDLEVVWLPDTHPTDPAWDTFLPNDASVADNRDRGWAWYPSIKSTKIYLRESGDPFLKTAKKFRDANPTAHALKVWQDVKAAYAMEAIAKVVHIRDGITTWSVADITKQFEALHLSAALTGLNSVEETVKILLRKTGAKKPKRTLRKKP